MKGEGDRKDETLVRCPRVPVRAASVLSALSHQHRSHSFESSSPERARGEFDLAELSTGSRVQARRERAGGEKTEARGKNSTLGIEQTP